MPVALRLPAKLDLKERKKVTIYLNLRAFQILLYNISSPSAIPKVIVLWMGYVGW